VAVRGRRKLPGGRLSRAGIWPKPGRTAFRPPPAPQSGHANRRKPACPASADALLARARLPSAGPPARPPSLSAGRAGSCKFTTLPGRATRPRRSCPRWLVSARPPRPLRRRHAAHRRRCGPRPAGAAAAGWLSRPGSCRSPPPPGGAPGALETRMHGCGTSWYRCGPAAGPGARKVLGLPVVTVAGAVTGLGDHLWPGRGGPVLLLPVRRPGSPG